MYVFLNFNKKEFELLTRLRYVCLNLKFNKTKVWAFGLPKKSSMFFSKFKGALLGCPNFDRTQLMANIIIL